MSVDGIAGTAIGVAIGVILAHWLLSLAGCAGAAPQHSTSYHVEIEAENITVTSEGEGMSESGPRVVYIKGADAHTGAEGEAGTVDESQDAEGGEATTDLDATVPVH